MRRFEDEPIGKIMLVIFGLMALAAVIYLAARG